MIRTAAAADFDAIVALNLESERFLSPMDRVRLVHLDAMAALHLVAEAHGEVAAFLLAFRESVDYDSPNYRWFDTRYDRFLYVDRVVVSSRARDAGLGSALYRNVFGKAAADAVPCVVCEYDVEPPNEASRRFHAAFGFTEVGRQRLPGGKAVSLQAAPVAPGRRGQ